MATPWYLGASNTGPQQWSPGASAVFYLPDPSQTTGSLTPLWKAMGSGKMQAYMQVPGEGSNNTIIDPSKVLSDPTIGKYTTSGNIRQVPAKGSWFDTALQTLGPIVGSYLIGDAFGGAAAGAVGGGTAGTAASIGTKLALSNMMGGGGQGAGRSGQQIPGQTGGGSMATTGGGIMDNLTLSNFMGGVQGVADYATSGKQQDIMSNAYGQAQNLIMQPSPEQAAIRQKTMGMINDPSSFFQDPLYQAAFGQGQQAIERSQASQGFTGSGNAAMELQKYGQTFGSDMYSQRLAQLAGLSGITQDPGTRAAGAQTLLGGAGMQANLLGDKTRALTSGLTSMTGANSLQGALGGGLSNIPLSSLYNMFTGSGDNYTSTSAFDPMTAMGGTFGDTSYFSGGSSDYLSSLSTPTDYSNMAGSTSDYISSLMQGF